MDTRKKNILRLVVNNCNHNNWRKQLLQSNNIINVTSKNVSQSFQQTLPIWWPTLYDIREARRYTNLVPDGVYLTYHGKYNNRQMTLSVHDLSNVPLFISELATREIFSYQVGQEVIINGDNIRWKYQQWRLIALITHIRYFIIPPKSKFSSGMRMWTSSGWIIRAARH